MTSRRIVPEQSSQEKLQESYQDIFVRDTVLRDTVFIVLGGIGFGDTEEVDIEKTPTERMHIMSIKSGGLMTAISHMATVPRDIRTFKQVFNKQRMSRLDTIIADDEDVKKVYKLIVTYTRNVGVKNIILIGLSYGAIKIALTLLKVVQDHKKGLDKIVFFAVGSPFLINKDLLPFTVDRKKDISIETETEEVNTIFNSYTPYLYNTAPLPISKPYSYATWLISKYNSRVISFYHVKDPYMKRWLPIVSTVSNIKIPTFNKYLKELDGGKNEYYDAEKGIFIVNKEGLDPNLPKDFKNDIYLYHTNVYILYKVLSWRYALYIRYIKKETPEKILYNSTWYRFIERPNVKTEDVVKRSLDFWGKVLVPKRL